jgi:ATP-dependent Clp protease ATP-binding subunit ClpB
VEDTIAILRGLKPRYDAHHGVRIQDSALVAAATLSHRYIADRFLPDKAIDLIDEAASRLRIENDSMPAELDEIRRRIMQLEIEREALRREKDEGSRRQLDQVEKQLADLNEQNATLTARWERNRVCSRGSRRSKSGSSRGKMSFRKPSGVVIWSGRHGSSTASFGSWRRSCSRAKPRWR